jgi:hypothetical protein|tara:strand:+ start:1769 stop:2686 length:918 start_codon:yes stop_codon:yes gene_type:complete
MLSDSNETPQVENDGIEEISMDTEIEIDGTTFTIQDLLAAQQRSTELEQQVGQLNDFKSSTMQLMSNEVSDEGRMRAARVVLSESGYSPQQIEEYMAQYSEAVNGGSEEFEESPEEPDFTEGETPMNYQDEEARRQAEATSEELRQYRLSMLQREMRQGVNNALDTNKEVDVLLGRLKSGDNSEAFDKARSSFEEQVHEQTVKMLQDRKSREGTFSEAWVGPTAQEATEKVLSTYRTVIGDIDSIGRAPETVSGESTFASKPPVPEPEFKAGMTRGDVDTSVQNWNTDVLSRLAEDTSAGDESKA